MSDTSREAQRWLAYELHDGLLQWMVGARMQLEAALAGDELQHTKNLRSTLRYIELAIEEGRELIGFLEEDARTGECEFELLMRQFVAAVRGLVESRQQQLTLKPPQPAWPRLPQSVLWNLLRISQQAVRNAIQHAGPASISIELGWEDAGHLRLDVSDTGVGYDVKRQTGAALGHFGQSSMQHRTRLVGGRMQVVTAPGKGCAVTIILPIDADWPANKPPA